MQTEEFKFRKDQIVAAILLPLVLLEPISKMIKQAIEFHEYYWYPLILFVVQYVYRIAIKGPFLMMIGVPAIVVTKKSITLNGKGYTIEWNDIYDLQFEVDHGETESHILKIMVKEPWKYIGQTKNPIMRYYRWHMLEYYDPLIIKLAGVDGDAYEIYNTIETYFYNYRGKKWPN